MLGVVIQKGRVYAGKRLTALPPWIQMWQEQGIMTNHNHTEVGCHLVGEYVDEAELPVNIACHRGEVVRPQVVANYIDLWSRDDGIKNFTISTKES
jgi:hypothetical protein